MIKIRRHLYLIISSLITCVLLLHSIASEAASGLEGTEKKSKTEREFKGSEEDRYNKPQNTKNVQTLFKDATYENFELHQDASESKKVFPEKLLEKRR